MKIPFFQSYLTPIIFGLLTSSAALAAPVTFNRPFAPGAHGFVHKTEMPHRAEICLNGRWDFQGVAVPPDFVRMAGKPPVLTDPVDSGWDSVPIKIPSPWNVNAFQSYPGVIPNAADYRYYPSYPEAWEKLEMAWIRKKFTVPKEWAGRDIRIHFEAVAGECEIRVNGKSIKRNFNLNLPFDALASEVVRFGAENELLVGVRRDTLFFKQGIGGHRALPSNTFWGWECAGIWQDVSIVALPKSHIADVFVQSLVDQDQLAIEVKIDGPEAAGCEVEWNVYRWVPPAPNKDLLTLPEQVGMLDKKVALNHPTAKVAGPSASTKVPVKGALDLWTPETPNLYSVIVDLKRNGQIIDRKYVRFGFHQPEFLGHSRLRSACNLAKMGFSELGGAAGFSYFRVG